MEEKAEKQLNEMLDSVNSINDEFINDYFNDEEFNVDDESDLMNKDEEITEDDIELIKPEFEWEKMPDDDITEDVKNESMDTESISGDLDLNDANSFDTNIVSDFDDFNDIDVSTDDIEKEIESDEYELDSFDTYEDEGVVSDSVTYRNLSGDELMKLLDKSKDGEDFFEKVEEIDD